MASRRARAIRLDGASQPEADRTDDPTGLNAGFAGNPEGDVRPVRCITARAKRHFVVPAFWPTKNLGAEHIFSIAAQHPLGSTAPAATLKFE